MPLCSDSDFKHKLFYDFIRNLIASLVPRLLPCFQCSKESDRSLTKSVDPLRLNIDNVQLHLEVSTEDSQLYTPWGRDTDTKLMYMSLNPPNIMHKKSSILPDTPGTLTVMTSEIIILLKGYSYVLREVLILTKVSTVTLIGTEITVICTSFGTLVLNRQIHY